MAKENSMQKALTAAGLTVVMLGAGAVPAVAASASGWHTSYVGEDTGYDDFLLDSVAAVGKKDAWAVGSRQQGPGTSGAVLHWNGSKWTEVSAPGNAGSFQVVGGSSPTDVWVLGFTTDGTPAAWHWNGTAWRFVTTGYRASGVTVLSPNDAWAVGGDESGNGTALHWDGKKWRTVPMPLTAYQIDAVAKNDVWAVGENTGDQPYAAHWNGTKWTAAKLPKVTVPKGSSGFANFVDVTAVSKNNVWAAGRFYSIAPGKTGHNRTLLMHWNGEKWSVLVGAHETYALNITSDGAGGIWYTTVHQSYVHRTKSGRATSYAAPKPSGRSDIDLRDLDLVPGGAGKVLAVGEVAPASGDRSWDAIVQRYDH
jgi:hypothetical protein